MTPREKVLRRGIVDWVALDRIHSDVAQENQGAPLSVVQTKTLELIRSLVNEGLFELGDLTGKEGRFAAWDSSLDESIKRIRDAYVAKSVWRWCCWLSLTEKGEQVAREIEARTQSALDG
ncbi:MAG: hypothetical protein JOZ49_20640 [Mycolicibacterium sp.]|nr:hypothetical protein [Mycolicibacterium sp.]